MQVAATERKRSLVRRPTALQWLSFLLQISLVVGVELTDDLFHGLVAQNNAHTALDNATEVARFEAAHDLWIEPSIQLFLTQTHHVLGMAIGWTQALPIIDTLYGLGHVVVTLAFAVWMFLYRRPLFAFIRNIFLLTNAMAVILYEAFPLAPPRLATGLTYDGHSFQFIDPVFGAAGHGLKLSFNEYAAMPSIHVAWALIVGGTLAWCARPLLLRILALVYPVIMLIAVIATGNHYIADGLGAVGVLGLATVLAMAIEWRHSNVQSFGQLLRRLNHIRHRSWADATDPAISPRQEANARSAA